MRSETYKLNIIDLNQTYTINNMRFINATGTSQNKKKCVINLKHTVNNI